MALQPLSETNLVELLEEHSSLPHAQVCEAVHALSSAGVEIVEPKESDPALIVENLLKANAGITDRGVIPIRLFGRKRS